MQKREAPAALAPSTASRTSSGVIILAAGTPVS